MKKLSTVKDSRAITGLHVDGADLIITFSSGNSYRYQSVGQELIMEMIASESPGKFFATKIKPAHECEQIDLNDLTNGEQNGNETNESAGTGQ